MSGAAVRTAYRLNVNKTKLYRLAKQYYPEIGPMKAAAFIKYPRSRDYALDFKVGERYYHLFLAVVKVRRAIVAELRGLGGAIPSVSRGFSHISRRGVRNSYRNESKN